MFLDHNGESEFPLSKDLVYEAMCKAIPSIKGMKVANADKLQGRIMVKAGVSFKSWGENIPIQLISINKNLTKVKITSTAKTGILFGGAVDFGKNRKNIESILSATSRILSTNDTNQTSEDYSINQDNIVSSTNKYENLERIASLLEKGLLSKEEFEEEKKKILSENVTYQEKLNKYTPDEVNTQDEVQNVVSNLKKLINLEKNTTFFDFGNSKCPEIINLLMDWCTTKDKCITLVKAYRLQTNSSLIEDLKNLSSSYSKIKEILNVFIYFEIIEPDYPHNITTDFLK